MENGFEKAMALKGGTAAWKKAGYPMGSGKDEKK